MNILRKNNLIDLEAPMYMADWQLEKFKNFMENTFDDVEFVDIVEPEREWEKRDGVSQVRFSLNEMFIMLQNGSMREKVKKLQKLYPDRKRWTIELKIGVIFPKFNKFLKKKGKTSVTREIVEEFLREMGWL